jgi:prolyl-tRNA synthetase
VRWSQALIPTQKETPADAVAPSHVYLLRAGLIRQLGSGAYTYLPLGHRVLQKAARIIREEMDAAGALELLMPALHPLELWQETGRDRTMGEVLMRFTLGGDRHVALGPTHEEVVTDLARDLMKSYRQLPVTLYQIQTKFRNEPRPRFGIVRTREFLMKDAYSFDANLDQLAASYDAMYEAYCRIFDRCGLPYVAVEAESGPIGGESSHEFMVPAAMGEDVVIQCPQCGYAANQERAEIGPPPAPAPPSPTDTAAAPEPAGGEGLVAKLTREWLPKIGAALGGAESDPEAASAPPPYSTVETPNRRTIQEVCDFLRIAPQETAKLLVYVADGRVVAALIRGDHEANEPKVRRGFGATSLAPADAATIEKAAGAPMGFLGPVGLSIPLAIDKSVAAMPAVVVGGNATDVHFRGVVPGRDFPLDRVLDLRNALGADPCPRCGAAMTLSQGIEIGHVFKLGTKYSRAMGATFLDDKGLSTPLIMGCYGIGVNRIVAAAVEAGHDANGIIWPLALAPYEALIIPLQIQEDGAVMQTAGAIARHLEAAGVEVLIDDRDQRPGFKFKDADLIGIPLRVVVGDRGLKEGTVEVKWRTDATAHAVPAEGAGAAILAELEGRRRALADLCDQKKSARAAARGR